MIHSLLVLLTSITIHSLMIHSLLESNDRFRFHHHKAKYDKDHDKRWNKFVRKRRITELETAEVLNKFFFNIVNNLSISKYCKYRSFIDNIVDQT